MEEIPQNFGQQQDELMQNQEHGINTVPELQPAKKERRIFKTLFRSLAVIVIATVLVTIGINAGDNAGNFSGSLLGSLISEEESACPSGMIFVNSEGGGFCIDKYEASAGQDCLNLNPGNQRESQSNINQPDCKPVSEKGKTPWRYINQNQAAAACRLADKRLPTNKEWYEAALGTSDLVTGAGCNLNNVSANGPGNTGERENCVSPAGAYDMVGNVWEWVNGNIVNGEHNGIVMPDAGYVTSADVSGMPLATQSEPDDAYNGDYLWINKEGVVGMFRGGHWGNNERAGIYSLYAYSPPSFSGTALGFRCVK